MQVAHDVDQTTSLFLSLPDILRNEFLCRCRFSADKSGENSTIALSVIAGQETNPNCYFPSTPSINILVVLAIYEEMIFAQGAFASEYVPGKKLKGR